MAKSVKRVSKKVATKTISRPTKKADICFVIMPFGGWFDKYYNEIYCTAIDNSGLEARRADDLYRPSNIVQDIWELTKKAKVILADLTHKNPNVFYELGLAHALAKPAILITENIDDIPFDLRSLRIIEYNKNSPDWGVLLQESIENAIKETLESPNETIPTAFLETKKSELPTPQITKQEKDFLELKQEMELIKRQIVRQSTVVSVTRPSVISDDKAKEIIRMRLDRGGEYSNNFFHQILMRYRIPRETRERLIQEVRDELNRSDESIKE